MPRFRVSGGAWRMPDGSLVYEGGEIDLPEDVAALHAGRVVELDPPADEPPPDEPA